MRERVGISALEEGEESEEEYEEVEMGYKEEEKRERGGEEDVVKDLDEDED